MNSTQAIQRVRDVIRRQHKALSTEETYAFWLRRYLRALHGMPEGLSSEKKLEQFLSDLARKHDICQQPKPGLQRNLVFL
jgi:arginyl-tRNA--protein-N-Asp/Glu arginylyltransferase